MSNYQFWLLMASLWFSTWLGGRMPTDFAVLVIIVMTIFSIFMTIAGLL